MMTKSVIGCGAGSIGPATTAFTQTLYPRPVMDLGGETASAVGCAVNSVSALARTNSLASGSGFGGAGAGPARRDGVGMNDAARSGRPHPASAPLAPARSKIPEFD